MIKYTLKCDQDHSFESWFADSGAYEALSGAGHIACMHCGSTKVSKSLMAPSVTAKSDKPDLTTPTEAETELAKMRKHVEDNADYVGKTFAKEARDMHDGVTPERPIYGEANLKEAKSLLEDGVPVLPLPFGNKRKGH